MCYISSVTINTTGILKESDHKVLGIKSGEDLIEKRDKYKMKFKESFRILNKEGKGTFGHNELH